MKRFIAVLSGLLIMPAFAEIAPIYYDDSADYVDEVPADYAATEDVQTVNPVVPAVSAQYSNTARSATRAVPSTDYSTSPRNTAQRVASGRGATAGVQARYNASATVSRASNGQTIQSVVSRRSAENAANTARAGSLTQTDTVSTPLYVARVGVRPSTNSSVVARATTVRAATTNSGTTTAASTPSIDELAQTTDFCKAQYTQCMDNFCNVLDDNQGRCSCSANIKNYSKTENALKEATQELQSVAQKIQYIGLTKDEISTLFTQTEAEAAMQGRTDNTQLKSDLDRVKNLVLDIKTGTATSDTSSGLDLSSLANLNFDNSGFDLNELFGGSSTNGSISNQRGSELYKTATSRCKAAVLDSCKSQGVDTMIITNSYDLEIDKQCISYERSLTDANTQMTTTVKNAQNVLQKARLVVAQQKNSYDLRGCINALDSCMQDDFVCGSDYENCLDPSGKYIVNGKVVVGSEPGVSGGGITSSTTVISSGLYSFWNYTGNNAWGSGNVGDFITQFIGSTSPLSTNMIGFLQQKIGYNTDGKNYGMCISVLNKCQDVSYTNGAYNRANKAVEGYLQRTLIQIKAAEDEVLSKYGEGCTEDVASCLSSNGYSSTASTVTKNSAINACSSTIRTCASVTGTTQADITTAATTAS